MNYVPVPWADQVQRQLKNKPPAAIQSPLAIPAGSQVVPLGFSARDLAKVQGDSEYARKNNEGVAAILAQQTQKAENLWQEALIINPEGAEVQGNLSIVYEARGEFEKALKGYAIAAKKIGKPWSEYYEQVIVKINSVKH